MEPFAINNIDSNANIAYPYDEIEKGLNLLGEDIERGHKKNKKLLKKLLGLLKKVQKKSYRDPELKRALIEMEIAETYLRRSKYRIARVYLQNAYLLIPKDQCRSIAREIRYKLEHLIEREKREG
jgi:hypothetical protein